MYTHTQRLFIRTVRYYLRPVKRIPLGIIRRLKRILLAVFRRIITPKIRYFLTKRFYAKPLKLNAWQPREKRFTRPDITDIPDKNVSLISDSFLIKSPMLDEYELIGKINEIISTSSNSFLNVK